MLSQEIRRINFPIVVAYTRYTQLMQHWHAVLPGTICDISYESLVASPEVTIRALLEHCELPFEKQCLRFHQTQRVVATASAQQVRKPIYKTSLRAWEMVAGELAPLREALGNAAR